MLSVHLYNLYVDAVLREVTKLNSGCKLGYNDSKNLGYADDTVLMAPSCRGLQDLLDKFTSLIGSLGLKINVEKSSYLVFSDRKSNVVQRQLWTDGKILQRKTKSVYLGVTLTENFTIDGDVDRVTGSFLRSFNGFLNKFNFADDCIKFFLFKNYNMSFYGIETWFESLRQSKIRKISVTYHKAVKRLCGFPPWESNHKSCDIVGVPLFLHLLAKRMICFFTGLLRSNSDCLVPLRHYFRYKSRFLNSLRLFFQDIYGLYNVVEHPLSAVISRITYVQRTEPRSGYVTQ